MLKHAVLVTSILLAMTACKKKEDKGTPATTETGSAGSAGAGTTAAKPAEPAAAVNPGTPSKDKDMLGLDLAPMGAWKPVWDPDAKVAKWENEGYMTGIVIRIVKDKLDNMEDLKSAAPMMMQLGTAVSKVVEEQKTPKGWWAIVETDEGKSTHMVYIQKYEGDAQLVCSGNLTKRVDATSAGGITKEEVIQACESIKIKG
ncbi:MAG: hypothetical protein H0T89_28050 [Deltaproteobacteria bacterium]|nr:hypothetical protein [Deltaproteobacteria bacterium]MDQ3298689.1 hypothetical protein [Myxococcota bacterium]